MLSSQPLSIRPRRWIASTAPGSPRRRPKPGRLQPGVDFFHDVVSAVIGPIAAGLSDDAGDDSLRDQIGLLHGVDVETAADVPCDVAMQWPHARVVGVVLNGEVAGRGRRAGLKELHVPALRVGPMHNGAVPGANAFRKHVEIVSVQMHRVSGARVVFDDDAHAVIVAEVVDVPLLTVVLT